MSATTSSRQLGIVLMAFQISFISASVFTLPLKCSLPPRSSALPSNFPLAVDMACAYVSLKPIPDLRTAGTSKRDTRLRAGASARQASAQPSPRQLADEGNPVTAGRNGEPGDVAQPEPVEVGHPRPLRVAASPGV